MRVSEETIATKTHVTYTRYGPDEGATETVPGDFILTHGNNLFDRLIRWGQALRFRGHRRRFARWNHASLIVDDQGGIIEAQSRGVRRENLSKYQPTEYYLVHIHASDQDRAEAVRYAHWALAHRERYGRLTIISVAIALLTGTHLYFGLEGQEICSGLVARALERTQAIFAHDPGHMMPADLAEHYNVEAPPKGTPIGKVPRH
jgi:hypothetical protein